MITKLMLSEIIEDQRTSFLKRRVIKRDTVVPTESKRIIIISGIRRCGKSTLIRQKNIYTKHALYINFEDPRLINFTLDDFPRLEELAREQQKTSLLLDEVQNIAEWERFVRMASEKGIGLFITGSNAAMLSRELGTRLTGRYIPVELFPFSYTEFLRFRGLKKNLKSFDEYFEKGGFPEFLEEGDDNYHRTLLRDIIMRDIAVKRNIINENQLIRLAIHLLSNIGKEFSYNKISKLLEFKSVRTVIDYCDYLQESYLLDFIPFYSASIKQQIINPKKVYSIDPAFATSNSLSFSKDLGRRLENFVYRKLRRDHREIYYFKHARGECDFLIKENEQVISLIQSCWEVNSDNISREIGGLKHAMAQTGTSNAAIITYNQEDRVEGIDLIPAWKWL